MSVGGSAIVVLTNGLCALVDIADAQALNRYVWSEHSRGYAYARVDGKQVLMHRMLVEASPGVEVDHINGSRLDNRRCNLRVCTHSENICNQGKHKNNTSGFKGVSWHRRDKRWVARIRHEGKSFNLGSFINPLDAAKVYDEACVRLHGLGFGRTNAALGLLPE